MAIALFLLITGLIVWIFPATSVFDSGYASLEGFFSLAPYLFIFLVPAVMMRSIAGEKMDGTYDLLMSRPLRLFDIVFGKFLGGLTIIFLAILPTVVYAISVYFLAYPVGNIDIGATIGSYLGLLLLAASFVSISLFCSAWTSNPIVAFLCAVFVNFLMFYGLGAFSQLLSLVSVSEVIRGFGIEEHYLAISRGVLLAEDFFYFLSVITVFIIFTLCLLDWKSAARSQMLRIATVTLFIIILLNQPFVTSLFDRIDFTEDKRYTLKETSKEIVEGLDTNIYITIFLDGDLPSSFKRLRQAAIDMALDLKSYSKGKILVNVMNPMEGTEDEQREFTSALMNRGLFPTNLNVKTSQGNEQKLVFPFAIVNHGEMEVNVNLLQDRTGQSPDQILNNSIQNLEYVMVSAISKVSNNGTSFIGFTEGHGEASDLELYDAMQSLAVSNRVGRLNLDSIKLADLNKISLMVIAKPKTSFSESDKYKIDYFVRNGGAVIWAIDQIDASMDYIRASGSQPLIGHQLNLDDQLFMYGVRLNYELIADLNCSQIPLSVGNIGGQAQIELVPWHFFPIIMPNSQHPIVKNLGGIRTEFVGTIDSVQANGIKKEVLLTSSPFTKITKTPSFISLRMIEEISNPHTFKSTNYPIAMLLQGKFPYIFENRNTPAGITEPVDLSAVSNKARMLVVADGDWLINQINSKDQSAFPLGWDRYAEQQYANKIFLENAVDYLLNDERVISLRNREVKLRLIDKARVKEQQLGWQILNVGIPILLLFIVGMIQQYMRKRRYMVKMN